MHNDLILGSVGNIINCAIFDTDGYTLLDLSTATNAYLFIKFPDGVTVQSHACTIVLTSTPGVNDYVSYTTISGDFPTVGTYLLQMQVIFPTGSYNSDLITLRVGDSIASTPVI